jgi:acyl transferase domain-containing protein
MEDTAHRAIAIVGAGAIMPDAPNVPAFWENIKAGRYCISEVTPDRWDPASYFDSDHTAPDKTYSKMALANSTARSAGYGPRAAMGSCLHA